MDFTKAALLIAVVFGGIELIEAAIPQIQALPKSKSGPLTVLIVVVVGQATIFLVGASVWAHDQIVGNHPLDKLNVASKIIGGLMLALAAVFGDKTLKAVTNIGQNQTQKPISK